MESRRAVPRDQGEQVNYTPEEIAELLKERQNQPHYIAALVRRAINAALAEPKHIHTCPPDCQKPLCVNRRREIAAAVEAEREACAEICDAEATIEGIAQRCATKIRARGCQK